MNTPSQIRLGTAGWSYKDWEDIVYPRGLKKTMHPVEYMACYFDVLEINNSFYGHIRPEIAKEWCRSARRSNPRFVFTAKLNRIFTHSPVAVIEGTNARTIHLDPKEERLAREGLEAIASEGMLAALLAQFPVSFKNHDENREYLDSLIKRFRGYPLVIEVRHNSWNDETTLEYFAGEGVSFCNIDQPRLGRSLRPTDHVTSAIGYVRLHGRNYAQWFDSDSRNDRYNYLYTAPELRQWEGNIRKIADKAQVTFVVANNHFEGKAAANALQLKSMISGERVRAPESLIRKYPDLAEVADVSSESDLELR